MRIVVLDGYTLNPGDNPWTSVSALGDLVVHDRTPQAQIVHRARDADILLTNKTPLSAATLAQLPRLRFICVLATGYNIVDTAAASARGIAVANVPEYGTDSVAQHVLAVLLHFCHQPALHDRLVREGRWQQCGDFSFWSTQLTELAGKRMGLVGFGRIGRRVGQLAHALGMEVLAYDVRPADPPPYQPFRWQSLDAIFDDSDVVSLHCPQTSDNVAMVNRALLSRMKPTAILINAARGGLVQEQDLADALNQGTLAAAALDVLSCEPPPPDHPLLHAKNCLITPHIAWATLEARRRMMAITADNVAAFLRGQPQNIVHEPRC
ncbi:MAG: D-2-hydroxyacid dehydrogenase [Pirellulaceae bacterium]